MKTKRNKRPEHHEQVKYVRWLEKLKQQGKVIQYTATAQNTWTPSILQVNLNRAAGVRKGFPDTVTALQKILLFIELKLPKRILRNGKIGKSPSTVMSEQIDWINTLNQYCCVFAFIAYGFEEAKKLTEGVLNGTIINKPYYELPEKSYQEKSYEEGGGSFSEFLQPNQREREEIRKFKNKATSN